jgi:DNA-binding GntR family transcriptional regulator
MNVHHLNGISPVENGTLGQRVYSQLRDFLMAGGVAPGEKITLRQLTGAFGTSLMPVREAVQRLAAEGALEVLPNRAIRVPVMTKAGVNEILAIRLMLEGQAVEEAAKLIQPDAIRRLDELNDAMNAEIRTQDESRSLFQANKEFHFTIYRAAGMPVLLEIIENLWLRIGPFLHFALGVRGREGSIKYVPDCHHRLIRAMVERNGAAGRDALEGDLRGAVELMFRFGNLPD